MLIRSRSGNPMNSASQNIETGTAHSDLQLSDENAKQAILFELEKVLRSQAFRSSERSRQFLAYVVRSSLAGQTDNLKERSIGVEVYHRKSNYATGEDPVVRISAGEVRKRLDQYYVSAPADTTLRIEIPRGSYAPEFHWTSRAQTDHGSNAPNAQLGSQPGALDGQVECEPPAVVSILELPPATREVPNTSGNTRRMSFGLLIATPIIVGLTFGCIFMCIQLRALHRSLDEWRYEPALRALWSGFLDSNRDTDVVTEDSSYLLLQTISKQRFSLQDYLNQDYFSRSQIQGSSNDLRTALDLIATKDLGRADDVKLVQRILVLDPLGSKFHPYGARAYTPALASAHNMILIGGALSNPWAELFDNRMNFTSDSKDVNTMQTVIRNRTPTAGEQQTYAPIYTEKPTIEYCSVAYLPSSNHNGRILVIEGTSWVATDAGVEFLLSEDQLSAFQKKIHATEFPYFNVLLKTTKVSNTPLDTTIEAYRIYPNLQ
jgi:hypothetical protein